MSLVGKRKILASACALGLLGALAAGCGDDSDDGDKDTGGTPDAGSSAPVEFSLTLVPITAQNASAPITIPHTVHLLRASDASPLDPPVTTSTGTNGVIKMSLPTDQLYTIYVEGTGVANGASSTFDTYLLNANPKSGETLLRISSAGTLSNAESSGGFTAKPDRASIAGGVYWAPGMTRAGTIGCVEIFVDGATTMSQEYDQRYMKTTPLPVRAEEASKTSRRGQFYFANMTTGKHTLVAKLNGVEIGSQEIFIPVTRSQAKSETKSVIMQVAMELDLPSNPTPENDPACPPLT